MAERTVVVAPGVGLHARPAALFVQEATASGVRVTIAKDGGAAADARSILSVLALDVRGGDSVRLAAEGEGAEVVLERLADLLMTPEAAAHG